MDVSLFDRPAGQASLLSCNMADLERKIHQFTGGRIRGLRLEEVGDAVILSGRTSTYYVKQLASQIALNEGGEVVFQNSIEVI